MLIIPCFLTFRTQKIRQELDNNEKNISDNFPFKSMENWPKTVTLKEISFAAVTFKIYYFYIDCAIFYNCFKYCNTILSHILLNNIEHSIKLGTKS